jgi:hypothetical protein
LSALLFLIFVRGLCVCSQPFRVGDAVRILPFSVEDAAALAEAHGGWAGACMGELLGRTGSVEEVLPAEQGSVRVLGKLWNPTMVVHLSAAEAAADAAAARKAAAGGRGDGWWGWGRSGASGGGRARAETSAEVAAEVSAMEAQLAAVAELEARADQKTRDYLCSDGFSAMVRRSALAALKRPPRARASAREETTSFGGLQLPTSLRFFSATGADPFPRARRVGRRSARRARMSARAR